MHDTNMGHDEDEYYRLAGRGCLSPSVIWLVASLLLVIGGVWLALE